SPRARAPSPTPAARRRGAPRGSRAPLPGTPRPPRAPPSRAGRSLADHLHQHALLAPPVELAVEDALPRSEVELPRGHRHHHLASHHLALEVGVGVVLAGVVVAVLIGGRVGREPLEPALVVAMEAALVVV